MRHPILTGSYLALKNRPGSWLRVTWARC